MSWKFRIIQLLRQMRNRRPEPDTFLIPAYAGLGNFIMMTPMILALSRIRPGAQIYLLTWPSYGTDQVFDAPSMPGWRSAASGHETHPSAHKVSGIFLLDPATPIWRKALFFFQLRSWRIETALIPFDACPAFVWWGFALAGCTRIFAHSLETMGIRMGWTASVADQSLPVALGSHESDIHLDLLDLCLGSSAPRDYTTYVHAFGPEALKKFGITPSGYIVVQLSAANARFKTPKLWDRNRFAELIRRLLADGHTVVLPGDENEKGLVDEFVTSHALSGVVNLAGRTSVREVSTVIKYARLLIVHDSGLMHIGNSHGTPLIALYGPTDWNFTAPRAPTSHILRKSLSCQPCMARMAKNEQEALRDCPIDVQCMRDISVEDVYRACEEVLGV